MSRAKLKYQVKPVLQALHVQLRPGGPGRSTLRQAVRHLNSRGFAPRTVLDIGVADGTYELYEGFPHAKHLLIEPMQEFEPALQRITAEYNAEYIIAAADEAAGELSFHVPAGERLHGASMFTSTDLGPSRVIPTVRLDDVVAERNAQGPMLLKVDVQGAELRVLAGAPDTLARCEVVILEASLHRFSPSMPLLQELIAYMVERDFVVYDLFGFHTRPLDGALAQCDVAFVQSSSQLCADSRYYEPGQQAGGLVVRAMSPLRRRLGV